MVTKAELVTQQSQTHFISSVSDKVKFVRIAPNFPEFIFRASIAQQPFCSPAVSLAGSGVKEYCESPGH